MKGTRSLQYFLVGIMIVIFSVISGWGMQKAANEPSKQDQVAQKQPDQSETTKGKPEKTDLQLGISGMGTGLFPVYVTIDGGFFKSEGLNVNLAVIKGGSNNIRALIGGSQDFNGGSGTEPLDAQIEGLPIVVFLSICNYTGVEWWANPNIKSIADVKGKRWGITSHGSLFDMIGREFLRRNGLDADKDVQILQVGSTPQQWAALKSGVVDVATMGTPGPSLAKKAGYTHLGNARDLSTSGDWPQETYYTTKDFLQKYPNTVKAIARAHSKAITFIYQNPDKAEEIVSKRLGYTMEESKAAIVDYLKSTSRLPVDGHFAEGGTTALLDIYERSGFFKGKTKVTMDMLYDQSIVKYLQDWLKAGGK